MEVGSFEEKLRFFDRHRTITKKKNKKTKKKTKNKLTNKAKWKQQNRLKNRCFLRASAAAAEFGVDGLGQW